MTSFLVIYLITAVAPVETSVETTKCIIKYDLLEENKTKRNRLSRKTPFYLKRPKQESTINSKR